jgi:hypothetical protein
MGGGGLGEALVIQAFLGNDERAIAQAIETLQPYVTVDAAETDPQAIWQESLFASNTVVSNYTAWTPAQRKRFVQADHDGMTVAVLVKKLGAKDPLKTQPSQEFALPARASEWNAWAQREGKDYGLTLTRDQAERLVRAVGENTWALHSELERWALAGAPLTPLPLTEHAVWAWADALVAGAGGGREGRSTSSHRLCSLARSANDSIRRRCTTYRQITRRLASIRTPGELPDSRVSTVGTWRARSTGCSA